MQFNHKKIVFVITDYGSFNNFLGEVAVSLSRNGAEVHLISSSTKVIKIEDKFDYKKEGIKIQTVELPRGFNPLNHFKASKRIHEIIDEIKPDVVSVHFTTGIFTTTFNKRLKYKTIGTIHGLGFPVVEGSLKKFIYRFVEKRSMNRVDEVWVLNKMDLDIIRKDFANVQVKLIPTKGLGCDLSKFDPKNFTFDFKENLKNTLEIKEQDFVIGFTGRFVTFKGYDKVVRAFKLLKEKGVQNIKLMLIGGPDDAHPTGLTEDEERWVRENESVINVGFSSKVQEYLSITDLFVFPSEKEGMPVCIIEALAMNVPVITADARGCNDLIENNKNGILLENNTPQEISKQMIYLKDNHEVYNQMKQQINNERLSMDRELFVTQQLDFFNQILNHS